MKLVLGLHSFMKRIKIITYLAGISMTLFSCSNTSQTIWQIGIADNSSNEFALAPDDNNSFLDNDFGWEDRFFIIGQSSDSTDWPYTLPGPSDNWGGTGGTSGLRSNTLNILFGLNKAPNSDLWKLIIDLHDSKADKLPVFKVSVNGKSWKLNIPEGSGNETIQSNSLEGLEYIIEIPFPAGLIKKGGNTISMTTIQGSWLLFDQIRLEGPDNAQLRQEKDVFLREVKLADYQIEQGSKEFQPLIVDVQHIKGSPELSVRLDGEEIFKNIIETGRYVFEVPMPAVKKKLISKYEILINGEQVEKDEIERTPEKLAKLVDYADTKMGTAHSRWMIAPGPWMPFSMVKLAPDNQNSGWQSGYDPIIESIGGFSHIHEWTMAGLLMMPTNGELKTQVGDQFDPDSGYRSRIDKDSEEAPIGYYKVELTDYNITAELTATTRCGFQRYTYPKAEDSRILLDFQFPVEYTFVLDEVQVEMVDEYHIQGSLKQRTQDVWDGAVQDYIVHFVAEFDQPIKKFGVWTEKGVQEGVKQLHKKNLKDAGSFVEFDTRINQTVQVRTGISFVSIENAHENLQAEIIEPYGWDFNAVRDFNRDTWNDIFNRLKITTNDRREKMRFYSNMYRSLCSRNTFSDIDGSWIDASEKLQKFDDPNSVALGCDAFWNTFWNLNQFWNLVTPEWSSRWVNSQLAMYDANGWLAKGPAGMEYIPVMVAEHEIPMIVGAYQMGIRDFDAEKAFEAAKKMQTTPARNDVGGRNGIAGTGHAGNHDLEAYLKYHYVPYDKGRFSNTLEYSFDDWTVAQFAKALGKEHDYEIFSKRGEYWRNAIDKETGYARMRKSDGSWYPDFDPYKSGANHHYVEGNAWQLTFFVPQDVPALAEAIGKERFIERLDWGFEESYKTRFNGKNDQYWNYPVVQGNQQSMHFAFLFNWVQKPWLTQKWSRAIIDRYYGYGLANAYLGDEDQGQMSAWFLMASLGLFQTDGGCRVEPIYEIGSPLYEKVEIDLGNLYGRGSKFTILAKNTSRKNLYVQSATLNGKILDKFWFPAKELLKGGNLVLEMGDKPNEGWGAKDM